MQSNLNNFSDILDCVENMQGQMVTRIRSADPF